MLDLIKKLRLGKLPQSFLEKEVIKRLSYGKNPSIIQGPSVGVDFAVVRVHGKYLIASSDPVTGVEEDIGWYAINVTANDVATSGNRPQFAELTILLPENSNIASLRRIVNGIRRGSRKLGISIIGGHTESSPGLEKPIVVVTAFAVAHRFVTSKDAKEGDAIVMTKTAGIEGTSILASMATKESLPDTIRTRAVRMRRRISVVREAIEAFSSNYADAMHDPTEGGLLGGVYEMGYASNFGFVLDGNAIPVHPITRRVCSIFDTDPIKLVASGSLIIAVQKKNVSNLIKRMSRTGIRSTKIGEFQKGRRILMRGKEEEEVNEVTDELWRILKD